MANLALSYNLTDPSLQRMKKQLKRRRGFRGKIFLTKKIKKVVENVAYMCCLRALLTGFTPLSSVFLVLRGKSSRQQDF